LTGEGPAGQIRVMDAGAIARIETFPLRIPFRPGGAQAARPPVDSLLVKVTTAGGLTGWGEAFGFEATPVTRRAVEDLIRPLCAGQDAGLIGPLMRAVQEKLQVFGRGGTVIHALSAVDTALWDIAGKAAGVPPAAHGPGPRLDAALGGPAKGDLSTCRRGRPTPATRLITPV
jgi:hypothetical protein